MKKSMLLIGLMVVGNSWAMTNFPVGNYHGKGYGIEQNGQESHYLVEARVGENKIESTYHFINGGTQKFTLAANFGKHGHFDVLSGSKKIGAGYCMSIWCHYTLKMGKNTVEETVTFFQNHLYRLGQKKINGKLISWEEDLEQE
ncbi:MAG: hypothetical protein A2X86_21985 [Bdellovibrionales bacterium GWA2_49_15]|nr:MAG: hypothetical protein A2X86_21985 [Bdellovibrionales bacterium GWA2_49_15]HAZ15005.1 hypothetical protein [Bdellovibrionales bacterium]